jgi:diguanylate cyclase (GGDEF)-like protein
MKVLRAVLFFVLGIFLFNICFAPSLAQASPIADESPFSGAVRFERLTVEDGLPNATVLSVLQDRQGFMWFATEDGLARYDGYSFTTFLHDADNPNSLSNNNTFALIESRDGLIWIGTDPGGLNVYDPQTGKFSLYLHDEANPNSLADDSVWSLLEDKDGSMWIGTRGGLSHLNRETGTFTNYVNDPDDPRSLAGIVVYRIYQDSSNTIWVGTRGGLQRYDPETDDFTTFQNNPDDPTSISSSNVWAMLEDSEGTFWVGTRGGGLNRFDRNTGKFTAYRHDVNDPTSIGDDRLWNIYEDRFKNLWVTSENGGLILFDRKTEKFRSFKHDPNNPFTISHSDTFWMTEDKSGVMWVTTRYGGVNKLYPMLWRFGLYRNVPGDPNSLSSNSIYCTLAEKNGIVWIGTFGGGLNRLNRKTGEMTVFRNDPNDPASVSSNKIYYIFRDEKGVLWVATSGGGLNRMDPKSGEFTAYKYSADTPNILGTNFLTVIDSAGNGRLWLGTLGFGLELFNPKTGKMEKEYFNDPENSNSLSEDTIYDIAIDKAGKMWIATARGGLDLLDPKTDTFTHHLNDPENSNSILSDTVHTIYLDEENGMVWAGTSNGLSGLKIASGQWQHYTTDNGLPNNRIVGIQPGKINDLWLSTSKGISNLSLETGAVRNYDARDGLQGDQFAIASSHLGPDGEIFFGGPNGLTFFDPAAITDNPYLPRVVFTDFQLFNETVPMGSELLPLPIEKTKKITLTHDQSVFTIKFSALSYQHSRKNLYQYKMEGFDKDWSPLRSKQEATYTNLSPGAYTFMVRATNNDGVPNEVPTMLEIEILPPWWGTWWFRALAVLTGIFIVLSGVQFRLNSIRRINLKLEERVRQRTQELQEMQEKLREQSIRDALTGLYNRHYLRERLDAEFSRALRKKHPIAFLLMDLDHFKEINDTYGHQAGDQALVAVSNVIASHTRQSDIACRYGGEEFMVIMPEVGLDNAQQRAEYFRKSIADLEIESNGKVIRLTISIGIAIFLTHATDSDKILSMADEAMYKAKQSGRNKIVVYSSES